MQHNHNSKGAILVLDIQNDFTGICAKMRVDAQQATSMIENLNKLIDRATQANLTVVYVGNEYSKFDILNIFRNFASVEGTLGTNLDSRLHVISDFYFSKNRMNAFSNPKLNQFLKKRNINTLYVSGLFAEACVYETTKGAIIHDYRTIVLTDCVASKTESKKNKAIEKCKKNGAQTTTSSLIK